MALSLPPLRLGSRGPEVQNWQRFLNETMAIGLNLDGAFGPRSDHATRTWQLARKLYADGVVGPKTRAVAVPDGFIQYLEARHMTRTTGRAIDLIVIHDMEYPETPESAEWCAQFFAGSNAPQASAHFSVDSDSIVQSVPEEHVAWHAPGANHDGIGVEHAGYVKQSRSDWLDPYSHAELTLSAKLVARLCNAYGIPVVWLEHEDVRAGLRGITGHAQVSRAFGKSTHWDPGPGFPADQYVQMVADAGLSSTGDRS